MLARLQFCLAFLVPLSALAAEPVVPIGAKVGDLSFKDIRYLSRSFADFPKAKAFALVFVDADCPLAQRYLPTLQQIDADYRNKGVALIAVDSGATDSIPATAALAVRHGCTISVRQGFRRRVRPRRWASAARRSVRSSTPPAPSVIAAGLTTSFGSPGRGRRRPRTNCGMRWTPFWRASPSPSKRRPWTAVR